MKRFLSLALIVAFLFLAGAGLVLSTATQTAVTRHYDQLAQRPTLADLTMQSRQTAPAPTTDRGNTALLGAGLFALVIIGGAGFMIGADRIKALLREARLSWRAFQRPQRPTSTPAVQDITAHLPPYDTMPRVRPVSQLEASHEDYQ